MQGLLVIDGAFSLRLEREVVGDLRPLDALAIAALNNFRGRYSELLNKASPEAGLVALG